MTQRSYFIRKWREKPQNSKQGSGEQILIPSELQLEVSEHLKKSVNLYNTLLSENVVHLNKPGLCYHKQCILIGYGQVHSILLSRVCSLRLDDHSDKRNSRDN